MREELTQEQAEAQARRLENNERLEKIIQPIPHAIYSVDCQFSYLEEMLAGYERDYGLNLNPDFQRGHVWTDAKRSAFVEGIMRRTVADSLLMIQFNAPAWAEGDRNSNSDLPEEVQIIDGLQRLTAVRRFLAGEITAFGLYADDFSYSRFDVRRNLYRLKFAVHAMQTRAELLRYYLAINRGGVVHSDEEIARVAALLEQAEGDA